jgi:endonuclease III
MMSLATSRKKRSSASKVGFDLPPKSRAEKSRAKRILDGFYKHYADAVCELDYTNVHELLVATILSAQATDVGVNKATPALFKRFPTPQHYAEATPAEIEQYIRTIGLFRSKAKSIHETMKRIVEVYGGEVPSTMEDLLTLRGVARKTANVVLGNAFGINMGVVVDTHVMRISRRFGLTEHTDAKKIERDLMALVPRPHWTQLSHMMIWHGRRICKARGALCAEHPLCRAYCSNARVDAV